jgi:hypothetical protein
MDLRDTLRSWFSRARVTRPRRHNAGQILRGEELEARELLSTFHFDFGPPHSPVAPGYTGASLETYSSQRGYGWENSAGMSWQNDGVGNALTSHFVSGTNSTFLVNLPNGYYDVMPSLGDTHAAHTVSIWAQGSQLANNLTTTAGQFAHPTYRVRVTDGQLALRIATKVPKGTFALNGLDINVGDGVFEHMNWQQMTADPAANINNPMVAGAEIHLSWSMLEPAKGVFNYQLLDKMLSIWESAGKKITLAIQTSPAGAERNLYAGSSTPQWVYDEGARYITVDKKGIIQKIPVLWDPIFQREFQTFIDKFAARYDGNPGFEFLIVGPGVFNSTRAVYPNQINVYQQAGYTDQKWDQAVVQIMADYKNAFHMTHLALGMSPFINNRKENSQFNEFQLARLAAQDGFYIYYHDLKGTRAWKKSPYPQFFASLGQETKIALGMDNPTSGSQSMRRKYGNPVTTMEYAFGGVNGLPPINTYYVVLYLNDVSAATRGNPQFQSQYYNALALAWDNLREHDQSW